MRGPSPLARAAAYHAAIVALRHGYPTLPRSTADNLSTGSSFLMVVWSLTDQESGGRAESLTREAGKHLFVLRQKTWSHNVTLRGLESGV